MHAVIVKNNREIDYVPPLFRMRSFSSLPSFLLERTMVVYISTVCRDSSIVDVQNTVCRCELSNKVLTFVRFCPRMRYKKLRRVYNPFFPFNPCCLHVDARTHFLVEYGICCAFFHNIIFGGSSEWVVWNLNPSHGSMSAGPLKSFQWTILAVTWLRHDSNI